MRKALVIGGAGFIGSNIVNEMVNAGFSVKVIDGMMPNTGARLDNITSVLSESCIIEKRLEDTAELDELLEWSDVVIAAFGWTSHKSAFDDPFYDMELNLKAHVYLLEKIKELKTKPFIINLATSVQFGKIDSNGVIEPDAEQFALDVQGIHKVAAEAYYRIFANVYDLDVYSVRLSNCFGPGQKTFGNDIGLIGSFIRDALQGKKLEVFGSGRKRSVIYVQDVAKIISRLATIRPRGFVPLNTPAHSIEIAQLATLAVEAAEAGNVTVGEMPSLIGKMDAASATFNCKTLLRMLPQTVLMPLEKSFQLTIQYFKSATYE